MTREARIARINAIANDVTKIDGEKGKLFSQIAKTIGEATSGSTLRSYRKPDAEASFAKLKNTPPLSAKELEAHRATVRQEQMSEVRVLMLPSLATSSKEVPVIDFVGSAAIRAKDLTLRSAQSAAIERLVKHPTIASWVEAGIPIHAEHSSGRCEFCDQPLSEERLKRLADHFSAEDQHLKQAIEAERADLRRATELLRDVTLPDRLALYSELRMDYDATSEAVHTALQVLATGLNIIDKALAEKLMRRTSSYEIDVSLETGQLAAAVSALQAVMKRHNDKASHFSKEKEVARTSIEGHYLMTIKTAVDALSDQSAKLQAEAYLLRNGGEGLDDPRSLGELSQSIADQQAKVSNAHAGGDDLTKHLRQFLGRTDLRFESGDDGYRVLRRGKPAKRLSEGEKTAIAFLYFLVQLKDRSFNLADGVVVIDDPISSLDASAIYQAFSFLKNETQGAKQLFILTHNFDFMKLLINWIKHIRGVPKAEKTYTMVLCAEMEAGRSAKLVRLDKLLVEHATEYHYLFKVLYTFKSDGTIGGCYHIPNIARKVLETFLDFHVPSSKDLYQKMDETKFDPHKKTAIYKFANDLSHHTGKSFDPALVAEAQKNTNYLLEMIEAVAPLHFQGLKELSET